jgi:hypothetical protein
MADKRIIEHTASTEILNDDWLLKDSATGGTTKILASVLRTLLGGDNFASTYDSSLTYYTGNMCIYDGILYKCKTFSGTTGTFDSSKWTQVTITDYASKLLASDWRATSSYVRDDLVSYRGSIYRCASDSATVGTFVNTEWITANWDSIRIVLLRNNIAKEYDGSEIYNKGDLVFESPYYLCVCKENGVTGTFDTSKWITDGTISDALELVDEQIIENIAGEYDSEVEYIKDALCFKDGVLYIANADTTGTWDSTKWNATTIADIIANLRIDANDVVDVSVKGYSLVNSSKIAVLDSLTAQGSASGSIASFSDGSTHPMSKLEIGIEPQQDLHGYDSPWVGGTGKNKYDPSSLNNKTVRGITATVSNGEITLNGTATDNAYFAVYALHLTSADGFSVSVNNPVAESNFHLALQTSEGQYYADNSLSNANVVIKSALTDCNGFIIYVKSGTALTNFKLKPQLEFGQTATAWTPYSNICPISGFTEANVVVSPTTDAEDGQTYNIQFKDDSNPLTVYGGTLDVVSGELTVDRVQKSINGGFSMAPNNVLYIDDMFTDGEVNNSVISNYYPFGTIVEATAGALSKEGQFCIQDVPKHGMRYMVYDSNFASASAFNTLLNSTPLQVNYELATPQTYQLTPTQVKSLLGTNNVWADTGDVNEAVYTRDLNTTVNDIISRIEALENA